MDFPSNSKSTRPGPDEMPEPTVEEKKIEPVAIEGTIIRRKKPLGRRFLESFFSGEAPKSIVGYVTESVLIPAAKDMIRDAGHEALDRILYSRSAERSSSRRSRPGSSSPYISYGRASQDRR